MDITSSSVQRFYKQYHRYFIKVEGKYFPKDIKVTETFLKLLEQNYNLSTLGESFLNQYFAFQFKYWKDLKTRFDYVPIGWVIGKKAFERWNNRKQEFSIKDLGITLSSPANLISEQQEAEKNKYYNTQQGFNHCLENTTLFNSNSLLCKSCNFKNDCIILLKENFPFLAKHRL